MTVYNYHNLYNKLTTLSGEVTHSHVGAGGILVTDVNHVITIDGSALAGSTGGGGEGGNNTVSGVAGESLEKYSVVYQSYDGKFYKAFNNNLPYQADAVGIVTNAITIASGVSGEITLEGQIVNSSWSWTVSSGNTLWLGSSLGDITHLCPTTSGVFAKPLGYVLTAISMWFHPELGWEIGTAAGAQLVVNVPVKGDTGSVGPTGATGLQGPQGVAGPATNSYSIAGQAGENLSRFDVVYQDYTDLGKFKKAACNNQATADACGLVTELTGIAPDGSGEITLWGLIEDVGWDWTSGKSLFLTSSGSMAQITPETMGCDYAKPLGRAITTSGIWWQPELGWWVSTISGTTASATITGTNGVLHIEVESGIVTTLTFV